MTTTRLPIPVPKGYELNHPSELPFGWRIETVESGSSGKRKTVEYSFPVLPHHFGGQNLDADYLRQLEGKVKSWVSRVKTSGQVKILKGSIHSQQPEDPRGQSYRSAASNPLSVYEIRVRAPAGDRGQPDLSEVIGVHRQLVGILNDKMRFWIGQKDLPDVARSVPIYRSQAGPELQSSQGDSLSAIKKDLEAGLRELEANDHPFYLLREINGKLHEQAAERARKLLDPTGKNQELRNFIEELTKKAHASFFSAYNLYVDAVQEARTGKNPEKEEEFERKAKEMDARMSGLRPSLRSISSPQAAERTEAAIGRLLSSHQKKITRLDTARSSICRSFAEIELDKGRTYHEAADRIMELVPKVSEGRQKEFAATAGSIASKALACYLDAEKKLVRRVTEIDEELNAPAASLGSYGEALKDITTKMRAEKQNLLNLTRSRIDELRKKYPELTKAP